jgi:predicted YcjX-like family ATPase
MNTFHLGIVGLGNVGKTVFLTSLLDHIFHHKKDQFRLDRNTSNVSIARVRELEESSKADDRFPYEAFRKMLAQGRQWPTKTRDTPRFSINFKRSDWRLSTNVHLFDFPGERFADSLMYKKRFEEWSDTFFHKMHGESEALDEFFALQERSPAPGADDLIREYRLCLAKMIHACRSLVTPSTFFLDRRGGQPSSHDSVEEWAKVRYAGLDEKQQFAPLIKPLRERAPDLANAFSVHYRTYRGEIVDPMFKRLCMCDGLAVLIDIPGILTNGMGMLNDTQAILQWLAQAVCPVEFAPFRWGRNVWNAIPWGKPRLCNLRRLAFVATKSDLIDSGDGNRMKNLLKDLAEEAEKCMDGLVHMRYFNCSSVRSTADRDGKLFGRAMLDPNGQLRGPRDPEVELSPTPMHRLEKWPSDGWDHEQFFFPDVYPNWPKHTNTPPEQDGLDKFFGFLLGDTKPE